MDERSWLLWDGDCDFCRKLASYLAGLDQRHVLTIIPYQHAPSPPLTPALRIHAARAVQLVLSDGRRFAGGRAVLRSLQVAGWHPRLANILLRRPQIWAIELGYWLVARNRHRLNRLLPER